MAWQGKSQRGVSSHGGDSLRGLPAVLDPSPFFAHIFSMNRTICMPKSGVGQGLEPHFFFWSNVRLCGWCWLGQVECSTTKPIINSAQPMAPVVPRAPQAPPLAIPVAGSGLAPFRHFFLLTAGNARPGAKARGFHAQGGCRGVRGQKGAAQGPPMYPLNGTIAGLVKGDT